MADKRSKLAEYFGLEELPPLTMADGVMRGIGRMSDQASEALGPLGAKLDAKLGTVGKPREGNYPQDPLLPAEPPVPQNRRGLFETLGAGVPQIAGFVAGNEVPMAGPVAPRGSVAAFPSPKQSMKAMQDEAVLRDMLEAKGARAIEPPPLSNAPLSRLAGTPEGGRIADALGANYGSRHALPQRPLGAGLPDGAGAPDFYGIQGLSANAARGNNQFAKLSEPSIPRRLSAEQTELEKYLAGLYGPKAK